jgi:3-hydroxyacyl-[acyl-carrier-protein] dehydratase
VTRKPLIVDLSEFDFDHVVADIHEIRKHNMQRFEMEQLTAIVYENIERNLCVGYKDVRPDEFWVRGHMPGMPLMPGVVMLEAAAQMCSYFAQKFHLLQTKVLGFGGLEDVRFREPVFPGDRLILICQLVKVRPGRMLVSQFQGVVRSKLAVEGVIKGIPLPDEALLRRS